MGSKRQDWRGKKTKKMGKKRNSKFSQSTLKQYLSFLNFMNYNLIWEEFASRFFTQPILGLAELFAIFIGIKYFRNDKLGRLFIYYICFDFIINIADWLLVGNTFISKKTNNNFVRITNTLITILELNIYYFFYKKILQREKINTWLNVLALFYAVVGAINIVAGYSFFSVSRNYASYLVFTTELILLLPPIILYFYNLINTHSEIKLFSRPSFWISVGIFFQSIISIPCYLILSYLLRQKVVFMPFIEASLYYIPLTINILFITKAFLCKKALTI
jgi:hypothetical protein